MPGSLLAFCGLIVVAVVAIGGNLLIERGKRLEADKKSKNRLQLQLASLASTASLVGSDPFLDGISRLEDQLRMLRATIAENTLGRLEERVILVHAFGEQSVARLKRFYDAYTVETKGDDTTNLGQEAEDIYDRLTREATALSAEFRSVREDLRDSPSLWDYVKV